MNFLLALKIEGIQSVFPTRTCHPAMKGFLALALSLIIPSFALGQLDDLGLLDAKPKVKVTKVEMSLVADVKVAAPGTPFHAAVKLVHAPEHHTYGEGVPEGVVGKASELTWKLPEGWALEELPWPATHATPSTGGKMSEGYDGTVYLPVKITPAGTP